MQNSYDANSFINVYNDEEIKDMIREEYRDEESEILNDHEVPEECIRNKILWKSNKELR